LYEAIDAVYDYLTAKGVVFPDGYKRRDPDEPGRIEKEKAEDKLARLVRKLFSAQKESVTAWLEEQYPGRKFAQTIPPDILKEEEIEAELFVLLLGFAVAGASLLINEIPVTELTAANITSLINMDTVKTKTIEWIQSYGYDLVKGINDFTLKGIRDALDYFVSTPGFTVGDAIAMMPFDAVRAEMVAVTETTRAYAQGALRVAEQLMEDYPDLRVVKTWYTNRDDKVCPYCKPLDNVTILADRKFAPLGFDGPPAHPRCRCWMIPRVDILGSDIE